MVVDVLLPAAAALAQLGGEPIALATVRALYACHPRLPANEVSQEMLRQFFGSDRTRAAIVNSACRQQALLQLYKDFCLSELETCQECAACSARNGQRDMPQEAELARSDAWRGANIAELAIAPATLCLTEV
jgi:hypothetical protein